MVGLQFGKVATFVLEVAGYLEVANEAKQVGKKNFMY